MYSSHTLLPHQLFSDSATQYFCWLPREHTTIGARASKEVDRVVDRVGRSVCLPNLPQTFRGRERSKSGYAVDLLTLNKAVLQGPRPEVTSGRF